jgi:hypothetical protein
MDRFKLPQSAGSGSAPRLYLEGGRAKRARLPLKAIIVGGVVFAASFLTVGAVFATGGGVKLCIPENHNLAVLTPNAKLQCTNTATSHYKLEELGAEGKPGPGVQTIAGTITAEGKIFSGSSFTVEHPSTGYYVIKFPAGTWSEEKCPITTLTPLVESGVVAVLKDSLCEPGGFAQDEVELQELGGTHAAINSFFNFIAVAPT